MSEEGRVVPSDMMQDIMPKQVTPVLGKGALGHGGNEKEPSQDTEPGKDGK
jgi:hypothetical protein